MNNKKFSPELKDSLSRSQKEAIRLGHKVIDTVHLLLGALGARDSLAVEVLMSLEVDIRELQSILETSEPNSPDEVGELKLGALNLTKVADKILKVMFLEAKMLKHDKVDPEHMVLAILKHRENLASRVLHKFDVDYDLYKAELAYVQEEKSFQEDQDQYEAEKEKEEKEEYLSLIFDLEEFTEEEISDVVLQLSSIYTSIGGDELEIKGKKNLFITEVYEPNLI